jgi:triacylglycerol esterase/lipase EstA (alpha/beta hydrolase family)
MNDFARLRADAAAVGKTVTRAMRRPGTYPGFLKEVFLAGMNVAMYPAGVVSEALRIDEDVRLGDRFTPALPLRYIDPVAAATPVLLVHGYFHNRSGFVRMRRTLRRIGFRYVEGWNYNAIGHDVPELARALGDHVFETLFTTGATQIHLVGHSLGGLIARYYVQELGGDAKVNTCVTLGTPHQGTYAAIMGRGRAARQLVPGSPLIRDLAAGARATQTKFVSYYSNLDSMVLPASNAKIAEQQLRPRNVLIKDQGHLSLLVSKPLIRDLTATLAQL